MTRFAVSPPAAVLVAFVAAGAAPVGAAPAPQPKLEDGSMEAAVTTTRSATLPGAWADTVLALAGEPTGPLRAVRPDTARAGAGPDAGLEDEVRARVARRWSVKPTRVVLDWSTGAEQAPWGEGTTVALDGSGVGGFWLVTVADALGSVRVRVRAGVTWPVPVAAHRLERGATLDEADVAWSSAVTWGPPSPAATAPKAGWTVRRVVAKGERLEPPAVVPPELVTSGERVWVVHRRGAVSIEVPAVALGSAREGEEVHVRTDWGRRLLGTVEEAGVVQVGAPGAGGSR